MRFPPEEKVLENVHSSPPRSVRGVLLQLVTCVTVFIMFFVLSKPLLVSCRVVLHGI